MIVFGDVFVEEYDEFFVFLHLQRVEALDEWNLHLVIVLNLSFDESFLPVELILLWQVSFQDMMRLSFFFSKVVDLWPVVVPQLQSGSVHLLIELSVILNLERREC